MFSFPENCKVVNGLAPVVGAAAAVAGAYISLKHAQKCWVVIQYNQADGNAITWRVDTASAIAGTNVLAATVLMPIWSNLATAVNDTMVRQADAINYASGAGVASKIIIFEVDPDALGLVGATQVRRDCIRGASTTAIAAAQYVSIFYVLQPRYQSAVATQPSVVID